MDPVEELMTITAEVQRFRAVSAERCAALTAEAQASGDTRRFSQACLAEADRAEATGADFAARIRAAAGRLPEGDPWRETAERVLGSLQDQTAVLRGLVSKLAALMTENDTTGEGD